MACSRRVLPRYASRLGSPRCSSATTDGRDSCVNTARTKSASLIWGRGGRFIAITSGMGGGTLNGRASGRSSQTMEAIAGGFWWDLVSLQAVTSSHSSYLIQFSQHVTCHQHPTSRFAKKPLSASCYHTLILSQLSSCRDSLFAALLWLSRCLSPCPRQFLSRPPCLRRRPDR